MFSKKEILSVVGVATGSLLIGIAGWNVYALGTVDKTATPAPVGISAAEKARMLAEKKQELMAQLDASSTPVSSNTEKALLKELDANNPPASHEEKARLMEALSAQQ